LTERWSFFYWTDISLVEDIFTEDHLTKDHFSGIFRLKDIFAGTKSRGHFYKDILVCIPSRREKYVRGQKNIFLPMSFYDKKTFIKTGSKGKEKVNRIFCTARNNLFKYMMNWYKSLLLPICLYPKPFYTHTFCFLYRTTKPLLAARGMLPGLTKLGPTHL